MSPTGPGDPRTTYAWQVLRKRRRDIGARNQEPCHRCGGPIDYSLPGTHRAGPTVDHVDPIGHGGEALPDLADLKMAHAHCNSRHGAILGNKMRAGRPPGTRPRRKPTAARPTFTIYARPAGTPPTHPAAPIVHTDAELGRIWPEDGWLTVTDTRGRDWWIRAATCGLPDCMCAAEATRDPAGLDREPDTECGHDHGPCSEVVDCPCECRAWVCPVAGCSCVEEAQALDDLYA